jgi:hypothetical protein
VLWPEVDTRMDTDGAARQVRSLKMENRVCNAYNNFFDNDGGGSLSAPQWLVRLQV